MKNDVKIPRKIAANQCVEWTTRLDRVINYITAVTEGVRKKSGEKS